MRHPAPLVTIRITAATRLRLKARGRKGDTYDAIIAHLLEEIL